MKMWPENEFLYYMENNPQFDNVIFYIIAFLVVVGASISASLPATSSKPKQ